MLQLTERHEEQPFEALFELPLRNGIHKKKNFHGSGVPIINMGELFDGDRIRIPPENLIEVTDSELERFGIEQGDLLFARRSLVLEGSGKTSLVEELGTAAVFESSVIRVRLDRTKADPDYYLAFFSSPEGRSRVLSIASQTAVSGIRGSDLAKLFVPVPPVQLQREVGRALKGLDDLIENNRRRIELLEETARLLYREWFVNFRYPGHEDVPLVDSELGRVPQGWKCSKIMDVAAIDYGDQLPKNQMGIGVIPVYGAAKQIGRHDKANTLEPTLIMGCRGSCGEVSITDSPAFVTNNSFLIKPKLCDRRQWLFLLLQDRGVGEFITGSAQPQITLANLAYLKIKEPPPELLDEFHRITSPLFELILNFHQQQIKIEEVRDLLLPRLVSGDLDISDLELDLEAVN